METTKRHKITHALAALCVAACAAFVLAWPAGSALAAEERVITILGEVYVIGELPGDAELTALQAQGALEAQAGDVQIANLTDLAAFAKRVNDGDTFEGATVSLKNNLIVLNDLSPIGTVKHPFEGTFDGEGHSLNVKVDPGASLENIGVFGYAGSHATIKNLKLEGNDKVALTVANSADGKTVKNIGAIAGYLGGSIQNCQSSIKVSVTNDGKIVLPEDTSKLEEGIVMNVGGLVGHLGGGMANCKHSGMLEINSKTDVVDGMTALGGYIGGLVGLQGDIAAAAAVYDITGCENTGAMAFSVTGEGGLDRFGSQLYSKVGMVGGVVGYAMGNVSDCHNAANLMTGVERDGAVQSGWGASTVGGIVGALRSTTYRDSFIDVAQATVGTATSDPGYDVWKKSGGATAPATVSVTNCSNTGKITGLASVGGICGGTGAFTQVVGCANTGMIEGTRWNKPCPAGIVGISDGDIKYCYNQGKVWSTTGGGYYAAGICGILSTYNTVMTKPELVIAVPEMCGCYVTGVVGGADAGFRTGVLAGENDGFIHDNVFLPNLTVDKEADEAIYGDDGQHSCLVAKDENRGTLSNNHELSAAAMKTSQSIAYLNRPNATRGDWSLYYVPVAGEFPKLSWQAAGAPIVKTDLASIVTAVALEDGDPAYSAVAPALPRVVLTTSNGTVLRQDADFKVVPDVAAPAGTNAGNTEYQATIQGINLYEGELSQKVAYRIVKADMSACTVTAATAVFNWEQQKPAWVKVFDAAGIEVPASEYTWETLAGDPSDTGNKGTGRVYKFTDYVNVHSAGYKYDVKVSAKDSAVNYEGNTTQSAFRIDWASLMYEPDREKDPDAVESAKFGDVVFGNQTWDIKKALKTKGFVKVKYTGEVIKPTLASVTYKGRELRNGTGKAYYNTPLDYDYKYVYGNPKPEQDDAIEKNNINVTGSDESGLAAMTVRFTAGGNFNNYTNMFFEITPASVADDVAVSGMARGYGYDGTAAVTPKPTLTYNGMTLVEGTDYTLAYADNNAPGMGKMTITGKGNYDGARVVDFIIRDARFSDIDYASDWVSTEGWVQKAVGYGLMSGYSGTTNFGSWDNVTREQAITVLYRDANPDSSATTDPAAYEGNQTPFTDAKPNTYSMAAINWAYKNKIMTGDSTTRFTTVRPGDPISREELAALLYRYAAFQKADLSGAETASYANAPDKAKVSSWATEAVGWCFAHGVMTGNSQTKELNPQGTAQRAAMAKMAVVTVDQISASRASVAAQSAGALVAGTWR